MTCCGVLQLTAPALAAGLTGNKRHENLQHTFRSKMRRMSDLVGDNTSTRQKLGVLSRPPPQIANRNATFMYPRGSFSALFRTTLCRTRKWAVAIGRYLVEFGGCSDMKGYMYTCTFVKFLSSSFSGSGIMGLVLFPLSDIADHYSCYCKASHFGEMRVVSK